MNISRPVFLQTTKGVVKSAQYGFVCQIDYCVKKKKRKKKSMQKTEDNNEKKKQT